MNRQSRKRAYKYGHFAEKMASWYLRFCGYSILANRFRVPVGEIDIIARRGRNLVFVEVKARKTPVEEVISSRQRKRIIRAAALFVAKKPKFATFYMRFDLIIIKPWKFPTHIKNAWQDEVYK